MSAPLRTLVVEDEPTTRLVIEEILLKRGHQVEACADAESAWTIAQREAFSLAVLDMRLPGMDGAELCRRLRKLPNGDEMVVMFVTGADGMEDLGRALDAGADDYILKPVGEANLPVRFALAERRVHFHRDRRRTEEGLLHNALRDSVTDLVNRTLFFERLQRTFRRASRENRKPDRATKYLYAVLVLNLDGFGKVNTRVGYDAANQILREVGHRIEDCIRSGDTVARFGGDEFVLLLDDMKDVSDPTRVVQRINSMFARPFAVGGETVRLTACVGTSLSVGGGTEPETLVEEARAALLTAKEEGPASHQIHDAIVHARAVARLHLESRLRWAVENGEMELHYQPIVSLPQGGIVGFEALVRWNDPQRGIVGPSEFVQVAEETGAILPLGAWVLQRATHQLADWNVGRYEHEHALFMNVNISGRQFADRDLVDQLHEALVRSDVAPRDLHVEITETALMTDLQAVTGVIRSIKEMGAQVYVDDFGTGYSSLSYLCRLPLDGLKIDRTFVAHMTDSQENWEIVRTITHLAETLRLQVVAEGVETDRQLDGLRKLDCRYAQGYLFGRPIAAEQATMLLRNEHPAA